jgi:ABC-type Zn uptake system ZnuABC Zn-binding protein ZnuA
MGQAGHFDAASCIPVVLDVPQTGITRAQGDVHPSGNPHYMLDPLNARAVARALSARLCRLDPLNESAYKQGLVSFLDRLDEAMFGADLLKKIASETLWDAEADGGLDALLSEQKAEALLGGWRGAMRKWKGKGIVTFHKNWSYFSNRFGVQVQTS